MDAHENVYVLACWHKVVSKGAEYLQVREIPFKAQPVDKNGLKEPIKGFFAYYPEGLFCLYKNDSDELSISWKGSWLPVHSISTVQWSFTSVGRRFAAIGAGGEVLLDFRYQTLKWSLIKKPLETICELFFPDDWWGLVADLPNWIDSGISDNKLDEHFRGMLKDHNKS